MYCSGIKKLAVIQLVLLVTIVVYGMVGVIALAVKELDAQDAEVDDPSLPPFNA